MDKRSAPIVFKPGAALMEKPEPGTIELGDNEIRIRLPEGMHFITDKIEFAKKILNDSYIKINSQ